MGMSEMNVKIDVGVRYRREEDVLMQRCLKVERKNGLSVCMGAGGRGGSQEFMSIVSE